MIKKLFVLFVIIIFTQSLLAAEIQYLGNTYPQPFAKKIVYKNGLIYLMHRGDPSAPFDLFKIQTDSMNTHLVISIYSEVVSSPVIGNHGDVYYTTYESGKTFLKYINPDNWKKNWTYEMDCNSDRIFAPLVFNEGVVVQTACGKMITINMLGKKIDEFDTFKSFSKQPILIQNGIILTGNSYKMFSIDLKLQEKGIITPHPYMQNTPGIISDDPPIGDGD